jgi:tetratricopeptide (TPR) repeat protein
VRPFRIAAAALEAGLMAASMVSGAPVAIAAPASSVFLRDSGDPLVQANAALQAGEADKALDLINSLPQPVSAEAHNLICRVRYTLEQWDAAIHECEQAVQQDGQNSNHHLWLGRALGEKADRANFLTAYSLAKRVRTEFEEAVRLNPRNADALADLGEFYKDAPGAVGGGVDKAEGIAAQLDKVDPARAHELRGQIAAGRKDYDTAEREFKQAIAASPHPALQWATLAGFYRKRERWPEMESAVNSLIAAVDRDKKSAVALYNGASVLAKAKRDPALAAKMLNSYLSSSAKTEEAPAFVAYTKLAYIDSQLGNSASAERDRAAAMALAHEYKPASDSVHQEDSH